jgi:hypothetical protein
MQEEARFVLTLATDNKPVGFGPLTVRAVPILRRTLSERQWIGGEDAKPLKNSSFREFNPIKTKPCGGAIGRRRRSKNKPLTFETGGTRTSSISEGCRINNEFCWRTRLRHKSLQGGK